MTLKRIDVPGYDQFIEITVREHRGRTYYGIEEREHVAGNWFPWEIREDGTRHIKSESGETLEEIEALIPAYIEDIKKYG